MQFIIEKAIEGILVNKSKAKELAEIIARTPNPEHAINLLFDNYVRPMFDMFKKDKDNEYIFKEYDVWENKVKYSYSKPKTKHIYIKKNTDKSLITHENYRDFEVSWSNGETEGFTIKFPEMETGETTCSKETWDKWETDYSKMLVTTPELPLEDPEDYDLI